MKDKLDLYLLRHALTTNVAQNRFYKVNEVTQFTEQGKEEVKAVADFFKGISIQKNWTSPTNRCHETTPEYITNREVVEALNDLDMGIYAGMLIKDVMNDYPDVFPTRKKDPYNYRWEGGESWADKEQQVASWFTSLPRADNQLLTSHAANITVLIKNLLNMHESEVDTKMIPTGSVSHLVYDGKWHAEEIGKVLL